MAEQERGPGWWKASDDRWYPPRWEYRLVTLTLLFKGGQSAADKELAELGSQGWEAVGITGEANKSGMVLMKRPIVE